jgi:hypothetical protein
VTPALHASFASFFPSVRSCIPPAHCRPDLMRQTHPRLAAAHRFFKGFLTCVIDWVGHAHMAAGCVSVSYFQGLNKQCDSASANVKVALHSSRDRDVLRGVWCAAHKFRRVGLIVAVQTLLYVSQIGDLRRPVTVDSPGGIQKHLHNSLSQTS